MKPTKAAAILLLTLISMAVQAQKGSLLVIANAKAEITIDGDKKGTLEAGTPRKFEQLTPGEHFIMLKPIADSLAKHEEVISIEADKQRLFKYDFTLVAASVPVIVAEATKPQNKEPLQPYTGEAMVVASINFTITGKAEANVWSTTNDKEFEYPTYYYAFEEGDEILFDFRMTNKRGECIVRVSTYPDEKVIYTNGNCTQLNGYKIKVPVRAIYKFYFGTDNTLDRECQMVIKRVPGWNTTAKFNTGTVEKNGFDTVYELRGDYTYTPETILQPTVAQLTAASPRVTVPVNLPANTMLWSYAMAVGETREEALAGLKKLDLAPNVQKSIDDKNALYPEFESSAPSEQGKPNIDAYLVNTKNSKNFLESKGYESLLKGSTTNTGAAAKAVNCCTSGPYFLALKPSQALDKTIFVAIEIVATVPKPTGNGEVKKVSTKFVDKKIIEMIEQ